MHLTCVQDLSTQAFLQALDRFVSIRGAPATIISDNGNCFRGAHNRIDELNLLLDQTELAQGTLQPFQGHMEVWTTWWTTQSGCGRANGQ